MATLVAAPGVRAAAQTAPRVAGLPADAVAARVAAYMDAAVAAEHFSGAILVARAGRPIVERGYGFANYELNAPATPATRFRLASLTKAFTAAAVLLLQERGRLHVDDPFCRYVDDVVDDCPAAWRAITIRHLLTHTSGIPNYTALAGYEDAAAAPATDAQVLARVRDLPLAFAPGTAYAYSNTGYHLLGMLIEQVAGQPYGDFLRESIFVPLGMRDTGRDTGRALVPRRAAGYTMDGGTRVNARHEDEATLRGEGGLYSTVDDLLRWDRGLATDALLTRASRKAMFTPYRNGYGFGWNVATLFGRPEVHHAGLSFGFATHLKRYPADSVAVAVLSNNQATDAGRVATDLSAIVFGAPYPAPGPPPAVAVRILAAHAGAYVLPPADTVTVSVSDGRLYAQGRGGGRSELRAASDTQFFLPTPGVRITFDRDAAGRTTGITLLKDGRETRAPRLGHP